MILMEKIVIIDTLDMDNGINFVRKILLYFLCILLSMIWLSHYIVAAAVNGWKVPVFM